MFYSNMADFCPPGSFTYVVNALQGPITVGCLQSPTVRKRNPNNFQKSRFLYAGIYCKRIELSTYVKSETSLVFLEVFEADSCEAGSSSISIGAVEPS